MKSKTMILMVVAVVCGLVASYLTSQLIAQRSKEVDLVVAKKAIPQWTPIKNPEEFFELRKWKEQDAPQNAVTDIKLLKDRVVLKDIEADKPVSETMLQDKNKVGLEGMLAPKSRGMAIVVNAASTAGGFVQPGSKVDIVHTTRSSGGVDTKMVLENVLVRAVDQQPVRPEDRASTIATTVTLELSPEQSLKLCTYKDTGTLTLLLRPFGDTSVIEASKDPIKPPEKELVVKNDQPKRKQGFVQNIINGPAVKQTPFYKQDKQWRNDNERNPDYQSPSGDSEGK
jgi:pilus assembly protein CpaB